MHMLFSQNLKKKKKKKRQADHNCKKEPIPNKIISVLTSKPGRAGSTSLSGLPSGKAPVLKYFPQSHKTHENFVP